MQSRRRFRPGLLPGIVTALMFIVLVALGSWQMSRSVEKRELLERFEQAPLQPAVSLAKLRGDWQQYRFRKISLQGAYDGERQILLENQMRNSQPGYMVLTPFRLAGTGDYVLVNRGWLPRKPDVRELPDVRLAAEAGGVTGLVSHVPAVGIKMGSLDESASGWPRSIPYIDVDWLGQQLGARVLPWIVLLDADQADGYVREWRPAVAVRMPPEKHEGYAFQWYSLALVLIFLFVAGSLKPEGSVKDDE